MSSLQCHACGHELPGPVPFCPNCGSRPMSEVEKANEGWTADPRNPDDKKSTVAMMDAVVPARDLAGPGPASPEAQSKTGLIILVGLVLVGAAIGLYFAFAG